MAQVRCDTCGVCTVEVDEEYDGTQYVACAACSGDEEESPEAIVARDVADDDAIHAAIENGADVGGLL